MNPTGLRFIPGPLYLLSTLLASFLVMPVKAEDKDKSRDLTQIPIEELANVEVYSASKFLQKVSNAPSSISIVTADEIQRHGYRTFAEILRSVTGFYVSYDRNYSYKRYADPGGEELEQGAISQNGRSYRIHLVYRAPLSGSEHYAQNSPQQP